MFVTIYRDDGNQEYIVDTLYITTKVEDFWKCKENKKIFKKMKEDNPKSTFRAEEFEFCPIYAFESHDSSWGGSRNKKKKE